MNSGVGLSFLIGGIVGASFKSSISEAKTNIVSLSQCVKEMAQVKIDLKDQLSKPTTESALLTNQLRATSDALVKLRAANIVDIKLKSNINDFKQSFGGLKSMLIGGIGASSGFLYADSLVKQAQGEVATLGISEAGIANITKTAQKFGMQFTGVTTPEFIKASYDIKSGISSLSDEGVAEFTRIAAVTAKATKSTVGNMTKLFSSGYGVFRAQFGSDEEFAQKFSNTIAGAVRAFRTEGTDMFNALSNLGGAATALNAPMADQIAVMGIMTRTYKDANAAATGYKAFLAGVGKAQQALGLEFTDAEGKMLPITDILDEIKEKYGSELGTLQFKDRMAAAFGGQESSKFLMDLIAESDNLKDSIQEMQKASLQSALAENMAKAAERGHEFDALTGSFKLLAELIGNSIRPAFAMLAKGITSIIHSISNFIIEHEILAKVLGSVSVCIGVFVTGIKIAILAKKAFGIAALWSRKQLLLFSVANLISSARLKLNTASLVAQSVAFRAVSLWTKIAAASQFILNGAFLACPITWIIAGIAAIGVGIYLLIKNFDTVWEKTKNVFGGIRDFLSGVWESIKGVFGGGVDFISNLLSGAITAWLMPFKVISGAISAVKSLIFGDDSPKIGSDIAGSSVQNSHIPNSINGQNVIDKYYGPGGMVSKANNINKGGNMTYSPQITVQGNASREDIEMAVNGGMKDFERNMFAYNEREARLSYAGD